MRRIALAALAAVAVSSLPARADAPAGALIGPVLFVTDVTQALRFYVRGLGMKVATEMGPPQRHETILTFGPDRSSPGIVLLSDVSGARPIPVVHAHGYERTILRMANLAALEARLAAGGFKTSPIRDVAKGYRMMTATDPDGYDYEIVEGGAASKGDKP